MDRIEDVDAPKTLDPPPRLAMAGVGAVSGLMSGIVFFHPATMSWAPGAIFVVAVMIPFRGSLGFWWVRALGAAFVGWVGYLAAVITVTSMHEPRFPLAVFGAAGAIGALVTGKGLLVLIGHPWRYGVLWRMVGIGTGAGLLFGALFPIDGLESIPLAFLIWQAATASPLGRLLVEVRSHRDRPLGPAARS